jgi:hypothetical protein
MVIFNIIAGDNDHIWISGNKQVVEFNPLTGASIQYDVQNDLTVTSLNRNAISIRSNSGLYLIFPTKQPQQGR